VNSVIFGVRLDELTSVDQLRGVATGFLEGDRAFRIAVSSAPRNSDHHSPSF